MRAAYETLMNSSHEPVYSEEDEDIIDAVTRAAEEGTPSTLAVYLYGYQ